MVMTKLEIFNTCLKGVGHSRRIVSPTENTVEAQHCRDVYDGCRRSLLQMGRWSFAVDTVTLADTGVTPTGWDYQYGYPQYTLKALEIARANANDPMIPFKAASVFDDATQAQSRVIWTNEYQAKLVRIRDVQLTSMFTPLFDQSLAALMAAEGIAAALAKRRDTAIKAAYDRFNFWFGQAVEQGEVEAEDVDEKDAPWITDR